MPEDEATEYAGKHLAKGLLSAMIAELAQGTRAYRDMTADEQKAVIERLRAAVLEGVSQAVQHIESRCHLSFPFDVRAIAIKDRLRLTVECGREPDALEQLSKLYSERVLVIPYVPAEYLHDLHSLRPAPDQADLGLMVPSGQPNGPMEEPAPDDWGLEADRRAAEPSQLPPPPQEAEEYLKARGGLRQARGRRRARQQVDA